MLILLPEKGKCHFKTTLTLTASKHKIRFLLIPVATFTQADGDPAEAACKLMDHSLFRALLLRLFHRRSKSCCLVE